MRKFPPREGDLPITELTLRASIEVEDDKKSGIETEIHFKFTCEECGERCMFDEPNKLYEFGECHKCGHETKVEVGGYTKIMKIGMNK